MFYFWFRHRCSVLRRIFVSVKDDIIDSLCIVMCLLNNIAESLERCAAGDTKCLAQLITKLMAGSRNGIPELGLESLDPLFFGNSSVSQQNAGPVSMNLTVSGGSILGWSKMKVKKVM